jgi:serine/threonine protein phosphatase PrpC
MEDKYCIHEGGRFAAVFDGHGGSCVSTYLSETLHNKIQHRLKSKEEVQNSNGRDSMALLKKIRILTDSISEVDEEILGNDDYQYQGSTAVAVWVHEDDDKGRTLVSANVGDSRAVMSQNGRVVDLTKDHKPNDPEEKKRIHAMGEKIEWDPYCNLHRVRNLSLSRAIGDKFAKPAVCSEVDIKTFPLHNSGCDDFVVLASDGLWDVMSSQVSYLI